MQYPYVARTLPARRIFWIVLLAILLLGQQNLPAHAASGGGVPVLLGFDDSPLGTPVFNQYTGVTFQYGDTINSAGIHPITIIKPSQGTVSGNQALEGNVRPTTEFGLSFMRIIFDVPQFRVSLSTGLNFTFIGNKGGTVMMEGYNGDANNLNKPLQLISEKIAPCLGSGPTPITTPMEVDDSAGRINFVDLIDISCGTPITGHTGGGPVVIDNLMYDRPLNPPPREHNPPVITIASPTNNASVTSTYIGTIDMEVKATVNEAGLASLTAQVNGHAAVFMIYNTIAPQTYGASVFLTDQNGLVIGANTVVLTARDFDQPQNTSSASVSFSFQVKPYPLILDIVPAAYEVTQTIDFGLQADWKYTPNGIVASNIPGDWEPPLVRFVDQHGTPTGGKPILIRIYAVAFGTNTPLKQVPATAHVERDHCTSNCGIPGADGILAPISKSSNGISIPNTNGITVLPATSFDYGDSQKQIANLNNSWNFLLPADWVKSDLVVTVNINAGNYSNLPQATPVPECTSDNPHTCNHNNQMELHLHFIVEGAHQVIIVNPVYLHIKGTYKGKSYDVKPGPMQVMQVDAIFQMLNELYPVRVFQGQRYDRTISPGISADDLADFMANNFDSKYSNVFFLGLLPNDQGTFAASANAAGTTSVGAQGAWADITDPIAAAHELGHVIGFEHWGCENGTTDDECGVFPIPHGGTGVVGTDIFNLRVIPPGDNSSNRTPHAHDIMSYGRVCELYGGGPGCNTGEWISWYDYAIILDLYTVNSYDPQDPPALLLAGTIAPNNVVTFQPIYQVNVNHPLTDTIVEDDASSIYTLQGFDINGNTLFVHNFEPLKVDIHTDENGKLLKFTEAVPIFANLYRIELLHGSAVLGTLVNPAPDQKPSVSITDPSIGTVWPVGKLQTIRWTSSSPAGVPLSALVEYSLDGGQTRIVLGRNLTGTSLTINPDELPGSASAMIYVQVSDGMNSTIATTGPFTIQPKPPSVHITVPRTNSQVIAHVPLSLEGTAYDRQETLTDAQFQWSSDRDGVLGAGQVLTVSKLSVGHHTLTLTVADSQGRVGRDTIQIDVVPFGGTSSPQLVDWLIFSSIILAILLLVLVLVNLDRRRRRRTGSQS